MLLFIPWPFGSLLAQPLELKTNAGFYTGASLRATHGRFIFGNGAAYAGSISYNVKKIRKRRNIWFELQYVYVSSPLSFERYDAPRKVKMGNMTMHTLLAGAGKQFGKGRVHPYGMVMAGAVFFDPDSLSRVKRRAFSFSVTTGLKFAITPAIGINMQVQALLPIMYNRVYVGWEPNAGLATAVVPIGVLISGYLTGGIYYNLVQ
jgi:hypothetical protein